MSNSSAFVGTASISYNPVISASGMRALFYADLRHQSAFNTGSDLDLEKVEDGYTVVNARIGIQGPDRNWSLELWAQNLFNEDYLQVAFDAFAQGATGTTERGVNQGFYTRSSQLFGAFLAEPRTVGVTLRGRFGGGRAVTPSYSPPPPPPPPPAAPVVEEPVAPPPPPAPSSGERG